MDSKKYNDTIVILKFVMSLLVIGIHSFTISRITSFIEFYIFQGIARLAVPMFFVFSSYFLYRKLSKSTFKDVTMRYVLRMVQLLLSWLLVLSPFILYVHVYLPLTGSSNRPLKAIQLLCQFVTSMQVSGLWFIYSCVICALCGYWLCKRNSKRFIIALSILSQIVCVAASTYFGVLPSVFQNLLLSIEKFTGNWYNTSIVAIAYFALGYYLSQKNKEKLFAYQYRYIGLVITMLLLSIEIYCTYKWNVYYATDAYVMLFPTTYFIALTCIDSNVSLKSNRIRKFLSITSTINYITQFAVFFMIQVVLKVCSITINAPIFYLCSCASICAVITLVVLLLENKIPFLKKLH